MLKELIEQFIITGNAEHIRTFVCKPNTVMIYYSKDYNVLIEIVLELQEPVYIGRYIEAIQRDTALIKSVSFYNQGD